MQRISILRIVTILLLFFTVFSCEKDILPEVDTENPEANISEPIVFNVTDTEKNQNNKRTVLGDLRQNPYTVENLAAAMNEVYETNIDEVVTTHLYVKFEPQSVDDMLALEEMDLFLFDFPLEREVVEMGDYYYEAVGKDDYPTYWTTVSADFNAPIKYEVLAALNLDMEADPFLMRRAFERTGNLAEEEGRFPIADNFKEKLGETDECRPSCSAWPCCLVGDIACDETSIPEDWWCNDWDVTCYPGTPDYPNCLNGPGNEKYNDCGCLISSNKRYPGGCVQVQDTELGMEGVRNVQVIGYNGWFRIDRTSTNDSGCWSINRDYRGKAWFWVKFKNDKCRIRGTSSSIQSIWQWITTTTDAVGRVEGPNFNNIQINYNLWTGDQGSNAQRYWGAATINNALHEFHEYVAADGLPTPEHLDITMSQNRIDGYALMHSQHIISDDAAIAGTTIALIAGPISALVGVVSWAVLQAYLPEINIGIDRQNSDLLKRLAYHEFAHASHYEQVGNDYWDHLVNSEILAGGHGESDGVNAGIIAVCESWAEYIGRTYADRTYGAITSLGTGQTWNRRLERTWNETNNHVPIGLHHDLVDDGEAPLSPFTTNTACNRFGGGCTMIVDNVSEFTNAQLFSCLRDNTFFIAQYQDCLINNHLGSTTNTVAQINDLFNSY